MDRTTSPDPIVPPPPSSPEGEVHIPGGAAGPGSAGKSMACGAGRRPTPILAVATDLDGTLLGPTGTVSKRTVEAVRQARRAGIAVIPATARPAAAMISACGPAPVGPLAVCSNGSVLVDVESGQVIHHHQLTAEVVTTIMSTLREALPGIRFAIETLDQFHYEEGMIDREAALRWGILTPPARDIGSRLDGAVTKLCCWHPRMRAAETATAVARVAGALAEVTSAGADWALAGAPGITKAVGLSNACRRLSIPADQVVAVGDELNDLPMLAWAAWPVAVANARDKVLEVASEVVPANVDDGVAQLLEQLSLDGDRIVAPPVAPE